MVVDLWGGTACRFENRAWTEDTVAVVFSATKGIVALAFLMLESRGQIDYDTPVADYWPEFAANGKGAITVRTLLNHQAGLIAVDEPISLEMIKSDRERLSNILEQQAPQWAAETSQAYHGVTYGLYTAELFHRVAGESLGTFIEREIATPTDADFHLGMSDEKAKRIEPRIATNYPASTFDRLFKIVPKLLFHGGTEGRVYRKVVFKKESGKAFANPKEVGPLGIANYNSEDVHQLELPWCNGIGNARSLCKIYAVLANGGSLGDVHFADSGHIEALYPRQSWSEMDRVLCKPVGWSQGFLKESGLFSPNDESFGHAGAGGSLGWCDPVAKVAIGYVMNRMDHHIRSPRAIRLCRSVNACL